MYISGSIEFLASKGSERRLITLRTESGEEQDYMVYNTVIPKEYWCFLFYLFKYLKNDLEIVGRVTYKPDSSLVKITIIVRTRAHLFINKNDLIF